MADFFIPSPNIGLLLGNQAVNFYSIKPDPFDQAIGKTYLGTPYYDQLTFYAPKVNQFFVGGIVGGVTLQQTTLTDLIMQTVLIEITQTKIIQKTLITGRNGTVKEYISDGDFMVHITGAIVGEYANQYPKDGVNKLINFCQIADPIKVSSGFLGLFNINSIVIENYSINEKQGTRNMVPFEIVASSDQPIEFQLK